MMLLSITIPLLGLALWQLFRERKYSERLFQRVCTLENGFATRNLVHVVTLDEVRCQGLDRQAAVADTSWQPLGPDGLAVMHEDALRELGLSTEQFACGHHKSKLPDTPDARIDQSMSEADRQTWGKL